MASSTTPFLDPIERLRDEMVFPSMLELTAQIRRDVEATRLWLLSRGEA